MSIENKNNYIKFLWIWIGQFFSIMGSGLTTFALGVYVFQQTQQVTSYSLIILTTFLPPFLLKPFSGVLADRFNRRLLMIAGDAGSSAGLLFIFFLMFTGQIQLWQIYLGIVISSGFGAIQEPAYKASVTDFLSEEHYARMSGLMQLAHSAKYLISPFLAGIILKYLHIHYIFVIDMVTFLLAVFIVLIVKKSMKDQATIAKKLNFFTDFKEGIKVFAQNRGVVNLVILTAFVLFFVGLLQTLFGPMLLSFTDAWALGISQSVCATGMIFGSLFLGLFGTVKKQVKILCLGLFAAGLFFANLGISTNLVYITIAGFLFFAALPFVNTAIEVLIRKNIANENQGRIWALISTLTYSGSIIAFATAGLLSDHLFNPLLKSNGMLADSVGTLIGVGPGRGIGLLLIIGGAMVTLISLLIIKNKFIKQLECVDKKNNELR